MKLFHVTQKSVFGYDTYSDFVCAAEDETDARSIYPGGAGYVWRYSEGAQEERWCDADRPLDWGMLDWCGPNNPTLEVYYLGEAADGVERGVICASYHAG